MGTRGVRSCPLVLNQGHRFTWNRSGFSRAFSSPALTAGRSVSTTLSHLLVASGPAVSPLSGCFREIGAKVPSPRSRGSSEVSPVPLARREEGPRLLFRKSQTE